MISSFFYKKGNPIETNLSRARMLSALSDKEGLLWVDLESPDEFESDTLVEIFNFHPLAVEDCIAEHSEPKIDDYEEYLFLVVHALTRVQGDKQQELSTIDLNLFLGPNYVVTFHKSPIISVTQDIAKVQQKAPGIMSSGADLLAHTILDHLVDRYLPVMYRYEEEVDDLEKEIFSASSTQENLERLLQLKQDISTLKRIVSPQRDTLYFLTRNAGHLIREQNLIYFRDISDHLFKISSLAVGMHDHLTSMLEVYFSFQSNELNESMRRLTILATLTMPAVVIASIYGMNFQNLPWANHPYGFWLCLAVCVLVTALMYFGMRIKKWM